ncbi:hypothetical protein [Microbacterium sp. AISO3]|uniref:hypothetical protein n=1 Tax=Microbacterium sp. AISO3 TaxID=2002831 RepID=UPI001131DE84|nr:hypothetical protein [Microbacterium sp. AISO3]
MVVLVLKDTYQAHTRADVRILEALDRGSHGLGLAEPDLRGQSVAEMVSTIRRSLTPIRQSTEDVTVAARGRGAPIPVERGDSVDDDED